MSEKNVTLEVMKQALEALEAMNPYPASKEDQRANAITALRAAIEQALAASKPEHLCPGCEGSPAPENNPCAVCGASKPPESDAQRPALRPLTEERWFQSELFKLAVQKGLLSIHTEHLADGWSKDVTKVSWMEGHSKACDISNEAAHGIKEQA